MSSLNRPLSGKALHFHLDEGRRSELIDAEVLERVGRTARTLIKDGPLRVTLVALGPGGELAEHHASGPITVHVLSGRVRFLGQGEEWVLEVGDLLSLPSGAPHAVGSEAGAVFLLTVASPPD